MWICCHGNSSGFYLTFGNHGKIWYKSFQTQLWPTQDHLEFSSIPIYPLPSTVAMATPLTFLWPLVTTAKYCTKVSRSNLTYPGSVNILFSPCISPVINCCHFNTSELSLTFGNHVLKFPDQMLTYPGSVSVLFSPCISSVINCCHGNSSDLSLTFGNHGKILYKSFPIKFWPTQDPLTFSSAPVYLLPSTVAMATLLNFL